VQAANAPPLDRVEAVTFSAPGTYLVICTFVPHFNDKMHGFVKVLP
jgi:plastocyanin